MDEYQEEKLSDDPVMNNILTQEKFLRENIKEKDFLNYGPTREVLYNNFRDEFDKLADKIEDFYEYERSNMVNSVSNMFYYDQYGGFISELKGIVLEHIKPIYDLNIIYEAPHIAKGLINNYENGITTQNTFTKKPAVIPKKKFSWGEINIKKK